MKSIKIKMVLYLGLLLVFVCAGFGIVSYINSSNAIMDNFEVSLTDTAKSSARIIEGQIEIHLASVAAFAENEHIKDPSIPWEEKVELLKAEAKRSGHIDMSVTDEKGITKFISGKTADVSQRDYFKKAISGKTAVSDPLVSQQDNTVVVVYAVPIKLNGKIIGVLSAARDGNDLSKITDGIVYGKTGNSFIINKVGTIIAHTDRNLVLSMDNSIENSKKDASLLALAEIEKQMIAGKSGMGEYVYKGTSKFVGYAPIKDTEWSVAIAVLRSEIFAGLNSLRNAVILMSLIFILIGIGVAYFISSVISNPIKIAAQHLETVATGDFTKDVPEKFAKSKDEIGVLIKSLKEMQASMRAAISGCDFRSHKGRQGRDRRRHQDGGAKCADRRCFGNDRGNIRRS